MSKYHDPAWQGISRVDHKHTHGWLARVYKKNRITVGKLFSDRKCGGKEEALAQARQWRDQYEIDAAERPVRRRFLPRPPKNNTSGRVGISKTFSRSSGAPGKKLWLFSVSWSEERCHPKTKSFYISHYASEAEAFQAACQFREEMERKIEQLNDEPLEA